MPVRTTDITPSPGRHGYDDNVTVAGGGSGRGSMPRPVSVSILRSPSYDVCFRLTRTGSLGDPGPEDKTCRNFAWLP